MFSGTAQVSQQVCQFLLVSSVCLLVRVIMVDKKQGCRLLFASHIGHNVIGKEEKKD
jgi:hypothetical protein